MVSVIHVSLTCLLFILSPPNAKNRKQCLVETCTRVFYHDIVDALSTTFIFTFRISSEFLEILVLYFKCNPFQFRSNLYCPTKGEVFFVTWQHLIYLFIIHFVKHICFLGKQMHNNAQCLKLFSHFVCKIFLHLTCSLIWPISTRNPIKCLDLLLSFN